MRRQEPICVGVLGTGTVVRSFHLPALLANPRTSLVALGNLHEDSLKALQTKYGIPKAYSDFEQMADDPEIDAVVNALPNYLHAKVSVRMLESGKHVLCEKPMATTVAEAQTMVSAAASARRKLMIAHVWRSHPEVRWLQELVRRGKLGTIFKVIAHAVVAGRGPAPESWFVKQSTSGGGALADVGIHSIDTISFLFDDRLKPVRVTARTANNSQRLEVEDTATVLLEYENGMTAQIDAGWYHNYAVEPHGAIEVFGTHGYARTLPARFHDGRDQGDSLDSSASAPRHPDDDLDVYAAQMDHFLDCILEDHPPVCDGQAGLADMMVLEAAYKSAVNRSTVALAW